MQDETKAGSELSGGLGALSRAAQDVLTERRRQIEAEGWTPEHDDRHIIGELPLAAASYALAGRTTTPIPTFWPWHPAWWKPSLDTRRNLVKAAALIIAEIERLDRRA